MAKNTAAVDPLLGRVFGRRYEVVALIARGGMATVYRAYDRQLDRTVAIKVPRPEFAGDRGFSEQFRREARAAARLGHPNIVTVYDSGEERGLPYIVLELVNGQTLRHVLDSRGRLTPQATAELLAEVADALDHAHRAGVVHLDVKPENILLTDQAVKVADFGLVRAVRDRPRHELAGTVQYLAPEVLRGGQVDGRADVYALGVVAYECLTGSAPFDGPDRREVARRHLEDRVPPPSATVGGIPSQVDFAVLTATEPDPNRRYRRAGELAAALGAPRRHWAEEALNGSPLITTQAIPRADMTGAGAGTVVNAAAVLPPAPPMAPQMDPQMAPTIAPGMLSPSRMDTVIADPGRGGGFGGAYGGGRARPSRTRHWPVLILATVLLVTSAIVGWPYFDPSVKTVPKLTGLTVDEAKAALDEAGLRLDEGDRISSRTVPEGQIASQLPESGAKIQRRNPVVVQVSSGRAIVEVPTLAGETESDAKAALKAAGLKADVSRSASDDVEEGRVIEADKRPGDDVREGSTVKLVVSEGDATVVVPELRGLDFDDAQDQLEELGLDAERHREPAFRVDEGEVTRTDPEAGAQVERGSEVRVFISRGPGLVRVPDVIGLEREEAEDRLRDEGLRPQFPLGAFFNGRVQNQVPGAGVPVPPGSPVVLQGRFGGGGDNNDGDGDN